LSYNSLILLAAPNLIRERNFTCALCAKRIGTRGGLLYHVKTHFKGRPYKCDVCNRSYATKNDFETHFKRHAGDNFTCDFCSKNFPVKDYLLVHLRAIHFPRVFPCTDCKKTKYFASEVDLKRHYTTNRLNLMKKLNARFMCKLCKTRFFKLKDYTAHCNERELLHFKCATCSKKFGCNKLFLDHVREERKAGFCEICKTNVKSFKMHFNRFHKKYTCGICKIFESTIYSEYSRHAGLCGTDAQVRALGHICTICGEHFRYKSSLNQHLNTKHSNNAHFWCAKCSKSYYSEDLLKVHIRSHKRKKNGKSQWHHFKCILCDPPKNFYSRSSFNSHFQANHGAGKQKKFACDRCKRAHVTKAILVEHIAQKCFAPKTALIPRRFTRSAIN
jgi:KRAB domain-containing zinc finger protein